MEEKTLKAKSLIRVRNPSVAHMKFERSFTYPETALRTGKIITCVFIEQVEQSIRVLTYMWSDHLIICMDHVKISE